MAIAAYLDGNYVIIPACILYYCFLSSFIVQMVGNRMRQLRAEEMNERLLEPQSVSIGLVSCAVGPGISREMILAAADAALYAAKQQGRNCICIGSNEGLATSIAT
jgi:GGDEF domain-containing protein